jgi:hypothetical protein
MCAVDSSGQSGGGVVELLDRILIWSDAEFPGGINEGGQGGATGLRILYVNHRQFLPSIDIIDQFLARTDSKRIVATS